MAKVRLDFGAELDVLSQRELDQSLSRASEATLAHARGIKWMRRAHPLADTPTSVTLGNPVAQGYAWDLKMITGMLTGSDSAAVFIGEDATGLLIGYAPAPGAAPAQPVFTIGWSSHQQVLMPGDELFVATSGAFGLTRVTVTAVQVPAEMLGKILS